MSEQLIEQIVEEFKNISKAAGDWCGCVEGDLADTFEFQQADVINFLRKSLQQLSDAKDKEWEEKVKDSFKSGLELGEANLKDRLGFKPSETLDDIIKFFARRIEWERRDQIEKDIEIIKSCKIDNPQSEDLEYNSVADDIAKTLSYQLNTK